MRTTWTALAVISVGYILAYLVFDRLRDRFGYVGGAEYIISLALGWLGMPLGTYFRLPTMALSDAAHLRIAFAEALTTFGCALAVLFAVFQTGCRGSGCPCRG